MISKQLICYSLLAFLALTLFGCATPTVRTNTATTTLQPDEDDNLGGSFLDSRDIRTIASQISSSLLSTPEISESDSISRIAVAPIRNSTRYIIDKDIFLKRLRLELNKHAKNRIRFFSQGLGQKVRKQILRELDEDDWDNIIENIATHFTNSKLISQSQRPINVAVLPIDNTNIKDLNADSFTSLIRSQISSKANGNVIFLAREKNGKIIDQILKEKNLANYDLIDRIKHAKPAGVDYFLGGEFISKSLQPVKPTTTDSTSLSKDKDDPGITTLKKTRSTQRPNSTKYLNVMLIDAQTGAIPLEKMVKIEKKIKTGLSKAKYILTGELSGLSKSGYGGDRSDYVLMSFQLVDPESNEILWEDFYETKKVSNKSVLYK